jgi:hypothetical protein
MGGNKGVAGYLGFANPSFPGSSKMTDSDDPFRKTNRDVTSLNYSSARLPINASRWAWVQLADVTFELRESHELGFDS